MLFDLLEHVAATWDDALRALSYPEPVSTQSAYYFHRLLGVPTKEGRAMTDPVFWKGELRKRGLEINSAMRSL